MKHSKVRAAKYKQVDVKEGNLVHGEVQGKKCVFLIDSGTTFNFMYFTHAKKLGLITGKEKTVTQTTQMWGGPEKLNIIVLEDVVITLGGCEMRIPIEVFPRKLEIVYALPEKIILGQQFLSPGLMFQEFHASGASTLYIRAPHRLQQPQSTAGKYSLIWLKAKRRFRKATPVVVDTGATGFYTTRTLTKKPPPRASLHLGSGSFMEASLELQPSNYKFYILGTELLYKYDAIVDYGYAFVTFKVGNKYLRVLHEQECEP